VLGPFTGGERAVATEAVERAADAAERILTEGLDQAMNHFNSRRGERGARN
jgi:peptidyl-tRNA hydrolase